VLKSDAEPKTTGFKIFLAVWQNGESPFHTNFNLKNPHIYLKKSKTQSVPHTYRKDVLKSAAETRQQVLRFFCHLAKLKNTFSCKFQFKEA
jgi:hypothetical protein